MAATTVATALDMRLKMLENQGFPAIEENIEYSLVTKSC
jgi:hypothetical protein